MNKKVILIYCVLILMVISGFSLRVRNYLGSTTRTIDELVYYHLGANLSRGEEYNTVRFSKLFLTIHPEYAPLPDYLTAPIFKHPPLFPMIIGVAIHIFGDQYLTGLFVSAFFGVLMILLVYLMGRLFADEHTGLLAAFLIWLDPIFLLSSQKIWVDSTLSFFLVLSLFLFACGSKYNKSNLYIFSGIAGGLAALTKYPGLLAFFSILLFSASQQPHLFSNRKFILGLFMPWILLVPWVYWCYKIYGFSFITEQAKIHYLFLTPLMVKIVLYILVLVLIAAVASWRFKINSVSRQALVSTEVSFKIRKYGRIVAGLLLGFLIGQDIIKNITFISLPSNSWNAGIFTGAPFFFYMKQLASFSLLYVIAFTTFFLKMGSQKDLNFFTRLAHFSICIIILFFSFWENFQSRYILASLPFLIFLAADFWLKGLAHFQNIPNKRIGQLGIGIWVLVGMVTVLRSFYINFFLVFPNDTCYF